MTKKNNKLTRDEELLEIKQLLLNEKAKIIKHLEDFQSEAHAELEQLSGDPADVASIEISQASRSKLGNRQQKLLAKIDKALDKFNTGDFGICELTGEDIPIARLRVRPVAQYTVEAKEMLEKKERGYRDGDNSEDEDYFSIGGESSGELSD